MKKFIILLVVLVLLAAALAGCSGKRYKVDYHGQQSQFSGARSSYREGAHVTLKYGTIGTDTDYSFYVDGKSVNAEYSSGQGCFIIEFTMPDHDIEVYCKAVNSMANYIMVTDEFEMTPMRCIFLRYDPDKPEFTPTEGQVSMNAENLGSSGTLQLDVSITNLTDEVFIYTGEFSLQKLTDGNYVELSPVREANIDEAPLEIQPGEAVTVTCDLRYYGDEDTFEEGLYRLFINGVSADFDVDVEWTE